MRKPTVGAAMAPYPNSQAALSDGNAGGAVNSTTKKDHPSPPPQANGGSPSKPAAMAPPSKAKAASGKLDSLQGLRFLAAIQIIIYHYYQYTPYKALNNQSLWGCTALTFFFMLSGFVMAYSYGNKNPRDIDLATFMLKRWTTLYPLYFFFIAIGILLVPSNAPVPVGLIIVLLLCSSRWLPSAFYNNINTPAWNVGAFFVLYLLFPFFLQILKSISFRTRLWVLPPLLWGLSMLQIALDMKANLGILQPVAVFIGPTSLPNFLQGINLGLLFLEHDWSKHPTIFQHWGLSLSLGGMLTLFSAVDPTTIHPTLSIWRLYGLVTPLHMVIVWYAARGKDPLCNLLSCRLMLYLGDISYAMYLSQDFVSHYMMHRPAWMEELSKLHYLPPIPFFGLITALAILSTHIIQDGYAAYLGKLLTAKLKAWKAGAGPSRYQAVLQALESIGVRVLATLAFTTTYFFFVNWQPCLTVKWDWCGDACAWAPIRLDTREWFSIQDMNDFVNHYAPPCSDWGGPWKHLDVPTANILSLAAALLAVAALPLLVLGPRLRGTLRAPPSLTRTTSIGEQAAATSARSVVLRLLVTDSCDSQVVSQTLAWLIQAASQLVDTSIGRLVSVEVVGPHVAALRKEQQDPLIELRAIQADATTLEQALMASTASEASNDDWLVLVTPGTRVTTAALQAMLGEVARSSREGVVTAFPTDLDGSLDSVVGLGTMAALVPLANQSGVMPGPTVMVTSMGVKLERMAPAIVSCLQHGVTTSGSVRMVRGVSPCAEHSRPSLWQRARTRLTRTRLVATRAPKGTMVLETFRMSAEAMIHTAFVLASLIILMAPIKIPCTPGGPAATWLSLDSIMEHVHCPAGKSTTGVPVFRYIMALIAALYSGAAFFHFTGVFRPSTGGLLRETILCVLLLLALPFTAAAEAVTAGLGSIRCLASCGSRRSQDEDMIEFSTYSPRKDEEQPLFEC